MSAVTEKAQRCKRLMDDQDFKDAFDTVENALLDGFKQVSLDQIRDDENILHELKLMLHLLQSVKDQISQAIRDGEVEVFNREQDQKVAPFLGDVLSWRKKTKER